jgi:hypothetical protein
MVSGTELRGGGSSAGANLPQYNHMKSQNSMIVDTNAFGSNHFPVGH